MAAVAAWLITFVSAVSVSLSVVGGADTAASREMGGPGSMRWAMLAVDCLAEGDARTGFDVLRAVAMCVGL